MDNQAFRVGRARTGLGLFAVRRIREGERIFEYTGRVISNDAADRYRSRSRYLYDLGPFTLDGSPRSNVGRYANHSCKPNSKSYTYAQRVYVKAIRDIAPGEEITYDYGKTYFDAYIGKDNCLCSACLARRARKRAASPAKNRRPEPKI